MEGSGVLGAERVDLRTHNDSNDSHEMKKYEEKTNEANPIQSEENQI